MSTRYDGPERRKEPRRHKCEACPIGDDGTCIEHGVMEERMKTMRGIAVWAIGVVGSIGALVLVITVPIVRSVSADTRAIQSTVNVWVAEGTRERERLNVVVERQDAVRERLSAVERTVETLCPPSRRR